jgi:apolipoprotein N-acyltransferase
MVTRGDRVARGAATVIPGGTARRSPTGVFANLGLLVLSAFLFALSFPSFLSDAGWFPLGFICLAPLFIVVHRSRWAAAPFYGIFFGYLSYVLFNYWLGRFHPLTLVVVPPIYAAYFVLVVPALKLADTLFPRYGFLLQSALWVCYEYFMKSSGFLAYSYGNIGYSQYPFIPFIQIADALGIWGVSLVVVYPSALLGKALSEGLQHARKAWRSWIAPAAGYLAVFVAVLLYGFLTQVGTASSRQWKVALVQQNVDPWRGGYNAYRQSLDVLLRQSKKAMTENPDIVIWSETSFVPAIDWHTRYRPDNDTYGLVQELRSFLSTQTVPYVVGNDDGELQRTSENNETRVDYNAAILFDKGRIVDTYRKLHLVPFTESFPFRKQLPGIYQWLKDADTHFWRKGDVLTVFDADGVRFSTPICFEDTFGYLCRGFVRRGAQVLVNMTNDAWSTSVPCAMQHMTMAVFRAVENRRSVVRSTNAGMTTIIDPNGRILKTLAPFTEGYLIGTVPVYTGTTTLYTMWGDWFPWLLLALSAVSVALGAGRMAARAKRKARADGTRAAEKGTDRISRNR